MINANRVTDDYSGDDKMALKYKAMIIRKTELVVIRETIPKGPNRVEKGRDGLALDFAGVSVIEFIVWVKPHDTNDV